MNEEPIIEKQTIRDDEIISWQAPEFIFHEKSADWFWAVIIITTALVVGAILIKNFLLGLLVGVSGFSILMYGAKRPSVINFSISNQGIQVGGKSYLFENLEYFWVDYSPPHKKQIILESSKLLMTHIIIPLGDTDPDFVREILLQHIKEKRIEESFSETISKFLKF